MVDLLSFIGSTLVEDLSSLGTVKFCSSSSILFISSTISDNPWSSVSSPSNLNLFSPSPWFSSSSASTSASTAGALFFRFNSGTKSKSLIIYCCCLPSPFLSKPLTLPSIVINFTTWASDSLIAFTSAALYCLGSRPFVSTSTTSTVTPAGKSISATPSSLPYSSARFLSTAENIPLTPLCALIRWPLISFFPPIPLYIFTGLVVVILPFLNSSTDFCCLGVVSTTGATSASTSVSTAGFACISVGLTNTGRSIEILKESPSFFIVVFIPGYASSILATSAFAVASSVVSKSL